MRDPEICLNACRGVQFAFHEAAIPSVPKSVAEPATSHHVNVNGTFNVFLAARDMNVRRVIYAASSSAYGESEALPKIETMPSSPLSP